MIQGKLLSYNDDLSEVLEILREVFIEELGYKQEQVFDGKDMEAVHVIIYEVSESKKAVAAGRLTYDGTEYCLSNIAVLKEFRNNGLGDLAVRMLLNKAFLSGARQVSVETIESNKKFYSNIGFCDDGGLFIKRGLRCFRMVITKNDLKKKCMNN